MGGNHLGAGNLEPARGAKRLVWAIEQSDSLDPAICRGQLVAEVVYHLADGDVAPRQ